MQAQRHVDDQAGRPASSSSPKRPRPATSAPPSAEKRRCVCSSAVDGSVRDGTLRIVAETLRGENRQLQQDRDVLQTEKQALTERLAQAQRSLRDMEDDMARVYRQKQKEMDAQRRAFEQNLQDARTTKNPCEQTTKEMDRFLRGCELWQKKVATLSGHLQVKTETMQQKEVSSVVRDLVMSVEIKTLEQQMETKEQLLHWASWLQTQAESCVDEVNRERQETEEYEAVERQLMNDRVVELETQLAQKRAVEREKEMELSALRTDHEELMRSSHGVSDEKFKTLVVEKKAMQAELKQLKEKVEELKSVDEERESLKQQHQKLVEEARQLREKQETSEAEVVRKSLAQDEEMKMFQGQLQTAKTRETKLAAALKGEIDKNKQRKEELKILYAKFSSSMDSVSEKTMRLEELEQELKGAHCKVHDVQNQNEELEKQVAQLQKDKSDLSAAQNREKDTMSEKLAKLQKRYVERESQQNELVDIMQSEIAELKAQNQALKKLQVKQEHQSVGQPSNEGGNQNAENESALVAQVAEKEVLQIFIQQYYRDAEEKCGRLLKKVGELESQKTSIQEKTKESCTALRMCTQVESWDESVRASLLDVMATLEGLT